MFRMNSKLGYCIPFFCLQKNVMHQAVYMHIAFRLVFACFSLSEPVPKVDLRETVQEGVWLQQQASQGRQGTCQVPWTSRQFRGTIVHLYLYKFLNQAKGTRKIIVTSALVALVLNNYCDIL